MSDEMAIGDNASNEDAKVNGDETVPESGEDAETAPTDPPTGPEVLKTEVSAEDAPNSEENIGEETAEVKTEPDIEPEKGPVAEDELDSVKKDDEVDNRGVKRRASTAFSDAGDEEFKGFDSADDKDVSVDYSRIVERLEAEVSAATKDFTPLRSVMATPPALIKAMKRARQDTDGSRPSSALSSRSDGDGVISTDATSAWSPSMRGRRATTEMSSPLLRVPLERGWRRELVYRAALDAHSRRNADIYYYTPHGKKLRSTREVAENLAGTGLTLENFSFFKEPLGVDDPEKEIIRDAKFIRRVESPVASAPPPPAEGKRTPKPKPPKGASPEPAVKSPPIKLKVKSLGSRLNSGPTATTPTTTPKQQKKLQPAPSADNNNTAAWKKPRLPPPHPPTPPPTAAPPPHTQAPPPPPQAPPTAQAPPPQPPPPLQSRPAVQASPDAQAWSEGVSAGAVSAARRLARPCSLTCGRGVPTLACAACLCLYHPACAGVSATQADPVLCKNCRKSSSPPVDPPPLLHKSGVAAAGSIPAPVPRRVPVPVPVPVQKVRPDKRVLLRMKVAGGGPDGERVWAVAKPTPQPPAPQLQPQLQPQPQVPQPQTPVRAAACPRALALRAALPQSLAILNGRRFIVVPRSVVQSSHHEDKRRGRIANGAASPPAASPRRGRGRPRADDTDYFTAFYHKAQEKNYNVVLQIFQYLGMRDLAHCARVCKLWRQLASTPCLWRHIRMKNSHVSDWGGLCDALKRHGTKRLDLRKMLLPQNDTVFWEQFAQHISKVDTLERIEMCRCPAAAVEAACAVSGLRALCALAIRDARLDPAPLARLPRLHELRLKSLAGLALASDLRPLARLHHLRHLSLTSIKELGWCLVDVVGQLGALEVLELGECSFRAEFAAALRQLARLRRLRLERGTAACAAPAILRALAHLPHLSALELVNVDVKVGFDDALAECKNIQRLLIIPTYVSQSATTNKQVLSGVLRLKDTLTHLMWGVTIELLRVTELFIDQCEQGADTKKKDIGECIPVLKPVPGCKLPEEHHHVAGPPQVEILPLPTLQRLLSAQLPTTKLKLLRIPFHATWRQSLADFQ